MKKIITTVLCTTLAVCNTLNAQETMKENKAFAVADMSSFKSHNNNPWGLVYNGAITENKEGAVNIHSITYELNGLKIAANVYTPAGYDRAKSYPALVVAHPNGGVKEQVAGLYSQRMAEAGYICLAFDAAIREPVKGNRAVRTSLPTVSRTSIVPPIFWRNIRVSILPVSVFSASVAVAAIR